MKYFDKNGKEISKLDFYTTLTYYNGDALIRQRKGLTADGRKYRKLEIDTIKIGETEIH